MLKPPLMLLCRHTSKDIAADEVVQDVSLGWDGKRDRSFFLCCHTYLNCMSVLF